MTWRISLKYIVGLLAHASIAATAMAHHAASNFDGSKQYIFHGTVKKFLWQNPHTWLYVTVNKADGTTEIWGFEGNGTNSLARIGWHATDLKEGDKVTVYGSPERNGKHNAIMAKVVLANGHVLDPMGLPNDRPLPEGVELPPGVGGRNVTPVEYK